MTREVTFADTAFYRDIRTRISDGRLFPGDLSADEAGRFAFVARSAERHLGARISAAVRNGDRAKALRHQRSYINDFASRYVAASKATTWNRPDQARRFETVYSRASLIGLGAEPGQMTVYKKVKARGGTRIIGEFGETDKAQQTLLAKAISPFFGDHRDQYGQRGKDLAVENLGKYVEEAGNDATFLHGDVHQFYDHVSHEWLREYVPLPRSLMKWVFATGYSITPRACRRQALRITAEEIERMAQCGLPQGSALSPFIAELVIADCIAETGLGRSHPLVNYSDNFGLVAPAEVASRLEQTLREGFRSHRAGPFDIRFTTRHVRGECRFCGYSFSRLDHGECNFWVRETDWRDRYAYHSDRLQNGSREVAEMSLRKMRSYIRAWPAWGQQGALMEMWEEHARSVCEHRGWLDLVSTIPRTVKGPKSAMGLPSCSRDLLSKIGTAE